jgi:hypothetical protein
MDDKKLDELIKEIRLEEHIPSNELVEMTKSRLKRKPMVKYTLITSVILNFLSVLLFIYVMVFLDIRLIYKAAIYITISTILNFIVLLVYHYKEQIKSLLKNSGLDYI